MPESMQYQADFGRSISLITVLTSKMNFLTPKTYILIYWMYHNNTISICLLFQANRPHRPEWKNINVVTFFISNYVFLRFLKQFLSEKSIFRNTLPFHCLNRPFQAISSRFLVIYATKKCFDLKNEILDPKNIYFDMLDVSCHKINICLVFRQFQAYRHN